jgi:glycosyltransferase involved in cell wall biosynthesis
MNSLDKTIVLHDYFESAEGGGRLSLTLARSLGADLAYGFLRAEHPYFADDGFEGRHYDLGCRTSLPLWRQFRLARAFETKTDFIGSYDAVIYSGFYAPLAVLNFGGARNIYYCHTPPRLLYDQRAFYYSRLPFVLHPLVNFFLRYLQPRYEAAVAKMDTVVTNSENVNKRLNQYLGVKGIIVHLPCDTKKFSNFGQENYYVSTARLDPLKRVDKVVRAFLKMPHETLIVASGGPELKRLQSLARGAANIVFTNWLSENKIHELIGKAIATIYVPRDEDFGMSPVESMAAGKPVIGVAEGGLLETIIDGETGILIPPELSLEQICEAVSKMTLKKALSMRSACEERAMVFSKEIFIEKMKGIIKDSPLKARV